MHAFMHEGDLERRGSSVHVGKTSALKGPQSRNQQGEISRGVTEKQQELRIRDGPGRMHGSP